MFKLLAKALTRSEQESLLEAKLAWILQVTRSCKVLLFGSAARFEMTDASDIDLILIFSDAFERDRTRQALYASRPKDDWPHDLLLYTEFEFDASVAKGGGAAYVAQQDARLGKKKYLVPLISTRK